VYRGNKFWFKAVPDFKGGFSGGIVLSGVVCKFHEGYQFYPVILLEVAKDSKVLF
jgi:hypothetical protein